MGYFGIGVYKPKTKGNIGSLWRSAYLLGADFIFTIAGGYQYSKTDTQKTWRQIPLFQWETLDIPKGCTVVGVETQSVFSGARNLQDYKHPKRALYILGNEKTGIPLEQLELCSEVVYIDAVRAQSYNVAMAGTILMYDRFMKSIKEL